MEICSREIGFLKHEQRSNPLAHNKMLTLVTPESDGVTGATIGEAIFRTTVSTPQEMAKMQSSASHHEVHWSRSLLWRAAKSPKSITGWSGAPLVDSETGEVLGFQNWMWWDPGYADDRGASGASWGDSIEAMRMFDETAVRALASSRFYVMYGSYMLPDEVTSSEFVDRLEPEEE